MARDGWDQFDPSPAHACLTALFREFGNPAPTQNFLVANVLSALVWAPLHIFPGVLAGMAINLAGPHAATLGLIFVGAIVGVSIGWHLLRDRLRAKVGAPSSE
jgi:hypothetical protein